MKQLLLTGALSLLGASRVFADGGNPGTPKEIVLVDPLQGQTFLGVVNAIAGALEIIAIPIVAVMVLYGAFQIMTAGGNPTKVSDGKKTILYAVVGYAVVLLGSSVVPILQDLLKK